MIDVPERDSGQWMHVQGVVVQHNTESCDVYGPWCKAELFVLCKIRRRSQQGVANTLMTAASHLCYAFRFTSPSRHRVARWWDTKLKSMPSLPPVHSSQLRSERSTWIWRSEPLDLFRLLLCIIALFFLPFSLLLTLFLFVVDTSHELLPLSKRAHTPPHRQIQYQRTNE